MTIREHIYFIYDGINSQDLGIQSVSISDGLYEEQFLYERSINEETTKRDVPYFKGIKREPYRFELNLYYDGTWDNAKIKTIANWLNKGYYKPLYFSDNPDMIFYCMYDGTISMVHNGAKQGYITLEMRCDSPYAYSQNKSFPKSLFAYNTTGTVISVDNNGDIAIFPEIWIKKTSEAGDVSIINQSNGNKELKFTGLSLNETVYVDCENDYIETDILGSYRYNSFNDYYLELIVGTNNLKVVGNCELTLRYRYKLLPK